MARGIALLALLCLISCSPKPELTKRYASFRQDTGTSSLISVSGFSTSATQSTAKTTLSNLSDRGQAALVEALAAKAKDGDALIALLGKEIAAKKKDTNFPDHTVFTRRVVLSVQNESKLPPDRLTKVRLVLRFNKGDSLEPKFKSWDTFVTKYETIDIGTLSFTQTREMGADIGFAPPPISSIGINYNATNTLAENIALKRRYVTSSGILRSDEAEIILEGAIGIDLSGNVAVDMVVDVCDHENTQELYYFTKLFKEDGSANTPSMIEFATKTATYPCQATRPLGVNLSAKAVLRRVAVGDDTIIEGDDAATYLDIEAAPQCFELIGAGDLRFSYWDLRDDNNAILHLHNPATGSDESIAFPAYQEAVDFAVWLQKSGAVDVRGRRLTLAGGTYAKTDAKRLTVFINTPNWGQEESPACPGEAKARSGQSS